MNTSRLFQTVVIFTVLTIAGISMIVLAQAAALAAIRQTLPLIGSAIFGSTLTYFLIEFTRWTQEKGR